MSAPEPQVKQKHQRKLRPRRLLIAFSGLMCTFTIVLKLSGGTLAIVHSQKVETSAAAKPQIYGTRLVLAFSSHPLAPPLITASPGKALKVTPAQLKACPLPKSVDVITGLYGGRLVKNQVIANQCYYGAWHAKPALSLGTVPADSPQAAAERPAPPTITFRKK